MRLRNIDFLKGLLILLVIAGHVLQATLDDNFFRYFIYSFHMPMFIGISGFLFNYEQAGKLSFTQLIGKYIFRVIVPWIIAVAVYTLVLKGDRLTLDNAHKVFGRALLLPYYHLWFIPGFLSWVIMSWLFAKMKLQITSVLVISAIISVILFVLKTYPASYAHSPVSFPAELILYTFRPYFYFYFVLGCYLRKAKPIQSFLFSPMILCVYIAATIALFFYPNKLINIPLVFLFNASLLAIIIEKAQKNGFPHARALEWIGINSLGIYLWHVLPIEVMKRTLGTSNLTLFYAATFLVEVVFIFFIYWLTKLNLINKYLFGGDIIKRTATQSSS